MFILLSKFEMRTGTFKSSRKIRRECNGNCFHENWRENHGAYVALAVTNTKYWSMCVGNLLLLNNVNNVTWALKSLTETF